MRTWYVIQCILSISTQQVAELFPFVCLLHDDACMTDSQPLRSRTSSQTFAVEDKNPPKHFFFKFSGRNNKVLVPF